jgi:hypothetical protein
LPERLSPNRLSPNRFFAETVFAKADLAEKNFAETVGIPLNISIIGIYLIVIIHLYTIKT